MDIIDYEEVAEDGSIDDDGDAQDEEDDGGLLQEGESTVLNEVEKTEVEDLQKSVIYSSLSSYMLKPPSVLTQGFKENNKSHNNLFNHMFNFGAREKWSNRRKDFSSYLDVDTRKY